MLLRSGRVTTLLGGPPRRGGGRRGSVEAAPARRVGRVKRKAAEDADPSSPMATATRRVKITSRPSPEALSTAQHGGGGGPPKVPDASDDDAAAVAELGIKLFPLLPSGQAAALWVGFVNDAKTCIKHYNIDHKANFVYKHEPSNGFYSIEERDGAAYYHMNFLAQDEDGNSQLFFGEIRSRVSPQVEDVTCCCPVTSCDAGGKGIRTIEEVMKYEYAEDNNTVGYDPEHCYACTSRVKHPKGTYYVAGHFADIREYCGELFLP